MSGKRATGPVSIMQLKFDGVREGDYSIAVTQEEIGQARKENPGENTMTSSGILFLNAAANIRAYYERRERYGFFITGIKAPFSARKFSPLDRAGLYVPGGSAFYPSTVLMNVIPARIAGVAGDLYFYPSGQRRPH